MSVLLLETKKVFQAIEGVFVNEKAMLAVEQSKEYQKYGGTVKNFIGIATTYALYANHFAYAVQYSESVDIEHIKKEINELKNLQPLSKDEVHRVYSSLDYNLMTNSGSVFLEERWSKVIDLIQKVTK